MPARATCLLLPDYVLHGDDPCLLPDGTDAYEHAKKMGRFKMVGAGAAGRFCSAARRMPAWAVHSQRPGIAAAHPTLPTCIFSLTHRRHSPTHPQIKRTEGVSTTDIVGRMLMCSRDNARFSSADREQLTLEFSMGNDDGTGACGSCRAAAWHPAGSCGRACVHGSRVTLELSMGNDDGTRACGLAGQGPRSGLLLRCSLSPPAPGQHLAHRAPPSLPVSAPPQTASRSASPARRRVRRGPATSPSPASCPPPAASCNSAAASRRRPARASCTSTEPLTCSTWGMWRS